MKIARNRSIIRKINILFTVSIVIILAAMIIFYVYSFRSVKSERLKYIEKVAENLVQNTNDIASSIMLTAETVSNTNYTRTLLMDKNSSMRSQAHQALNKLIIRLVKSSSHIRAILFLDNEGKVFNFNLYDYSFASKLDREHNIFTMETEGFSAALQMADTEETYYVYTQPIYYDYIDVETSQIIGTCLIICSVDSLNQACEKAYVSQNSYFAIQDQDNQILACNLEGVDRTASEKENAFCESYPISQTGWEVFCSVPYWDFYSELLPIHYIAVLLIAVLLGVCFLLVFQIRSSLIVPLDKTVKFLMQPPYQLMHERLEEEGDDEMFILSVNINQMLDKLYDLNHTVLQNQARLYEIELLKDQAQLQALQSQINPHFLYNTLNCIQGLACQKKYQEICTAVADLSFVLRYSIQEGNFSTVKEEFRCIDRYLQIINIRFPGRFRFQLLMEEGAEAYEMPRFLLQPLVENAVSHGLKERPKGSLTVSATCDSDSILHIKCTDDGVGIAPERLSLLRQALDEASAEQKDQNDSRFGIGLINVQRRIKIQYGEAWGLSIDSTHGSGTTICVDFPVNLGK